MQEFKLGSSFPINCTHERTRFMRSYTRKKDGRVVEVRCCLLCQKSFSIGADSLSDKRCRAIQELMEGKSYRETSVSLSLAGKMAKKLKHKRPLCGCGKPPHRGLCSARSRKASRKACVTKRANQLTKLKRLLADAGVYTMGPAGPIGV